MPSMSTTEINIPVRRSTEIIRSVMSAYVIDEQEFFFGRRTPELVKARMAAGNRLRSAGYSVTQIAQFMKCDRSSVSYYLYPKVRKTRKDRKARIRIGQLEIKERAKAEAILSEVMAEYQLTTGEFFSRHHDHYMVAARVDAAMRMSAMGLSSTVIGQILKRSNSTVRHYLNPNLRATKRAGEVGKWMGSRILKFLDAETRATVIDIAKAENVVPEVIIGQWVAERARHEAQERA